ncbi:fumarylacetoacetate hydrolase family protein [soil metagenome]
MKLARYKSGSGIEQLGVVVGGEAHERLLNVAKAAGGSGRKLPETMTALIASGDRGLDELKQLQHWSASRADATWFDSLDAVEWLTPVPARSCIAAGRNFGRHLEESRRGHAAATGSQTDFQTEFPTGFIKLGRALVPHKAVVARPREVLKFDYEVEIAVVVGKDLDDVGIQEARKSIFGYTVFNDLSAREWQFKEMQNKLVMIGKNFPGFGPVGPYILTADEVPDPARLTLWLNVNGEQRQHSDCSDLIFGFDEMVSFWSRVGLQAGDLISCGTPDGVAVHRKPDPAPFYLKPGDIVHAGVDQIGVLETRIVESASVARKTLHA